MTYRFDKSGKLKPYTPEELAAADQTSSVLVFDQGTTQDGKPYWAFLAVKPSKYEAFLKASTARQPMQFADYGQILESGIGAEVPPAVQETIKKKYGFDKDYKPRLIQAAKQAQAAHIKQQEDRRIGDIVAMMKKKQSGG